MNRYRTIPGLGQPKPSSTTICQKCLKKGHYSYECKSTTQERPYMSRPSRTQQLLNPRLKPKLTSDEENTLMKKQGIADAELARTQAAREAATDTKRSQSPEPKRSAPDHARSASVSSYDSVSTISTSRSRSPRPAQRASPAPASHGRTGRSHSRSTSRHRKRKYRESSISRSPRFDSSHKARRYRSDSPEDRGRPADKRRGSNRSRSREVSSNRSEITKQRRSLDEVQPSDRYSRGERHTDGRLSERPDLRQARAPPPRKERSLSPYSRRLALTQAMNMGR